MSIRSSTSSLKSAFIMLAFFCFPFISISATSNLDSLSSSLSERDAILPPPDVGFVALQEREMEELETEVLVKLVDRNKENSDPMELYQKLNRRKDKKNHHHKNKHHHHHHHHKNHHHKHKGNKTDNGHPHKDRKHRHPSPSNHNQHSTLNAVFPNSQCSDPKANALRPNGHISFLNCGIQSKNGWNPPPVKLQDLKMISGQDAIQKPIFAPCKKYFHQFQSIEKETGVPAVILMSFAMQESTCNKGCNGPNGEIGLMQLTKENCHELGVNPGDAWDPETNIRLGAKQFRQYLDQNHGNAIISIGQYNGWYKGLTEAKARNKQYGCGSQNNLDYLDSFLNGFLQGKDGYGDEFKTYNNLAECGDMQ